MVKCELENFINGLTFLMFEERVGDEKLNDYVNGNNNYIGHYAKSFYRNLEIAFHVSNIELENLQCNAYLDNAEEKPFQGSGNVLQGAARLGLYEVVEFVLQKGVLNWFMIYIHFYSFDM